MVGSGRAIDWIKKLIHKIDLQFFRLFLNVLELFEFRPSHPYMSTIKNFVGFGRFMSKYVIRFMLVSA